MTRLTAGLAVPLVATLALAAGWAGSGDSIGTDLAEAGLATRLAFDNQAIILTLQRAELHGWTALATGDQRERAAMEAGFVRADGDIDRLVKQLAKPETRAMSYELRAAAEQLSEGTHLLAIIQDADEEAKARPIATAIEAAQRFGGSSERLDRYLTERAADLLAAARHRAARMVAVAAIAGLIALLAGLGASLAIVRLAARRVAEMMSAMFEPAESSHTVAIRRAAPRDEIAEIAKAVEISISKLRHAAPPAVGLRRDLLAIGNHRSEPFSGTERRRHKGGA